VFSRQIFDDIPEKAKNDALMEFAALEAIIGGGADKRITGWVEFKDGISLPKRFQFMPPRVGHQPVPQTCLRVLEGFTPTGGKAP
jgi:hypothetical protein